MNPLSRLLIIIILAGSLLPMFAQDDVTIVAPTSEAAEGLDLQAVSELFKDAENLEAFEKSLNDPETGVNNLDLDDNGEVDYIRLVEEVADDAHVIILQAALGADEFQDVATIEVERNDEDDYNMQVRGNEDIYGVNYYVAPVQVHVHTWPIIGWMYRPYYRPYRSVYYWGSYPRWWKPYRPVTVRVYRTRTVRFTSRKSFTVTRTSRVHSVTRVNYKARSSTRVKKTTVTRTTTTRKKTTTVKKGTKRTNKKAGRTTVKKGVKKKNNKAGKTTVKKGTKKKTAKARGNRKTVAKKGAKKSTVKKNR